MSAIESGPVLHVPARDIPVPTSVSPQAQAMLALGPVGPTVVWPESGDVEEWRAAVAAQRRGLFEMVPGLGPMPDVALEEFEVDGVRLSIATPAGVQSDDRRAFLHVHGGGFVLDDPTRSTIVAKMVGARTWAVDYRMPPDHPFPAGLDDCVAAYRVLLRERGPEEIIVGGDSAGGNLAAALIVRARDEGLPLPSAAVLMSGAFDLTLSGDTYQTNFGIDNVFTSDMSSVARLYAGAHGLAEPYLSPLYADFTTGFPPTIILTGTRDVLLSDNVRMHRALRAANVPAELHVFEAMGHGRFLGMAPEDRDHDREVRRFVDEHWSARSGAR